MQPSMARPPDFPRPSSSVAKSRLKDRLLLSSTSKQKSETPHKKEAVGIGENQFDKFDEQEYDLSMPLSQQSLLKHDSTIKKKFASMSLARADVPLTERPDTTSTQHTTVADSITGNKKWDRIATSLANGNTEFCYMEELKDNSYKFLFSSVPASRNFSTISRFGILRMQDGSAEKIEFETFMHEHHIHAKLIKLPVFGKFRIWKTLKMWKQIITNKKRSRVRFSLNSSRKLTDSRLRDAAVFVFLKAMEIRNLRIMKIEDNVVSSIQDFAKSLEDQRTSSRVQKQRILDEIKEYLSRLGESFITQDVDKLPEFVSLSAFKPGSFAANSSLSIMDTSSRVALPENSMEFNQSSIASSWHFAHPEIGLDSDAEYESVFDPSKPSNDNLYVRFFPTKLSYTQRSLIRQNCRHYYRFLRWVDFFIRNSCYQSAEFSLSRFCLFVAGMDYSVNAAGDTNVEGLVSANFNASSIPTRPASGILYLQAVLTTPEIASLKEATNISKPSLTISPAREVFEEFIEDSVLETKLFGSQTESFCSDSFCGDLLTPILDELPPCSLDNLVEIDPDNSVNKYHKLSCELIKSDMSRAETIVNNYRDFVIETANTLLLYLATSNAEMFNGTSVESITSQLIEFDSLRDKIQIIPPKIEVGLIHLNLSFVQSKLLSLVQQCTTLSHRIIPEYFGVLSDKFNLAISILLRSLEEPPDNLDQFVTKVEVYNNASNSLDSQRTEYNLLIGLRELLDSFSINYKSLQPLANSTSSIWSKYNDSISDFTEKLETRTKQYKSDLKARARVLLAPMEAAKVFIVSNFVLNPDSSPAAVLADLKKIQIEMEAVRSESLIIEKYQEIIKVRVFNIDPVNEIIDELNRYSIQWNNMKLIKEMQVELLESKFMDVLCEQMMRDIRSASLEVNNLISANGSNLVLAWLKEAIEDLQIAVPVIYNLQASTLKERHTAIIHASIGRPIFDELDLTVGELIAMGLKSSKSVIEKVFERSCFERTIEKKLLLFSQQSDSREFDIASDKENKNILYFANLDNVIDFYQDLLVSFDSMSRSEFSSPFSSELLEANTSAVKSFQFCLSLKTLQDKYLVFRVLFSSTRTARHLNFCVRLFKTIDENWKNIVKCARADASVRSNSHSESVLSYISIALELSRELDAALLQYLNEQRERWPKLCLLPPEQLMDAFATYDPHSVFQKCIGLMPHLTDIIFDTTDTNSVIAAVSGVETVELMRPSSARSNLIDWLQGIDASLSDRLYSDFRIALESTSKSIVDDAKNSKLSLQSKLCAIQAKFWGEFENIKMGTKSLRLELKEIFDKIKGIQSARHNLSTKLENVSFDSILILLLDYRDLIASLVIDEDNQLDISCSFRIESKFKKNWDARSSQLFVQYGFFSSTYGMRYLGIGNRLVITPATEKFFVSLAIACSENCGSGIPIVSGKRGAFKSQLIRNMGYELGVEAFIQDASLLTSVEDVHRIVKATYGSGLWMVLNNVELLSMPLLTECMTLLSLARLALLDKKHKVQINETTSLAIPISSLIPKPKFCMVFGCGSDEKTTNASVKFLLNLPNSVLNTFRPIHMVQPSLEIIMKYLLTIANFGNVTVLTTRLYSCIQHIIANYDVDECVVRRIIKSGIKSAGCSLLLDFEHAASTNTASQVNTALVNSLRYQTELLYKHAIAPIFKSVASKEAVTESQLRFICSMFLEILIPQIEIEVSSIPADRLISSYKQIRDCGGSIIVVGASGCGKSTIIRNSMSQVIDNEAQLMQIRENSRTIHPYQLPRRVINPWIMMSSSEERGRTDVGQHIHSRRDAGKSHQNQQHQHEHHHQPYSSPHRSDAILVDAINHEYFADFESVHKNSDVLLRFVHVDVPCSRALASVLPLIDVRQLRQERSNVCIVWEVCDVSHLDPTQALQFPIISINECNVTIDAVIGSYFQGELCSKEGKVYQETIRNCVYEILMPCLEQSAVASSGSLESSARPSRQPGHLLAINVLNMFDTMFVASGLTLRTKFRWDELSVKRIFIFCCIWTVGLASSTSKEFFDNWFKDYFDRLSKNKKWNNSFPYLSPFCTVFDSILQPIEEESVKLEWVVWDPIVRARIVSESSAISSEQVTLRTYKGRLIDVAAQSSLLMSQAIYSTIPLTGPSVVLATPTSMALRLYQNCILNERNASKAHSLSIIGEEYSGKTSLLQRLLTDSSILAKNKQVQIIDNKHSVIEDISITSRWICVTGDGSSASLHGALGECQAVAGPQLVCRDYPILGAIFIEDVNLSVHSLEIGSQSGEGNVPLMHILRHMTETGEYYNPLKQKWVSCAGQFDLITSTISHSNRINERFLKNRQLFWLASADVTSLHIKQLKRECFNLPEELCDDLILLTTRLIEQFQAISIIRNSGSHGKSAVGDVDTSSAVPAEKVNYNLPLLSKSLESFSGLLLIQPKAATLNQIMCPVTTALAHMTVYTTVDAIRIWERTISDFLFLGSQMVSLFDQSLEAILANSIFKFANFSDLVKRERSKHLTAISSAERSATPVDMAVGYSNNSSDCFLGMYHPLHLREAFQAKYTSLSNSDNLSIVDKDSQQFWYSILKLITAVLASGSRAGQCGIAFVEAPSKMVAEETIKGAAKICTANYAKIIISNSSNSLESEDDKAGELIQFHLMSNLLKFVDQLISAISPNAAEGSNFGDIIEASIFNENFAAKLAQVKAQCKNIYHVYVDCECHLTHSFWRSLSTISSCISIPFRQLLLDNGIADLFSSAALRRLIQEFISCQCLIFTFGYDNYLHYLLNSKEWSEAPKALKAVRYVDVQAPTCLEAYLLKKMVGADLTVVAMDLLSNITEVTSTIVKCRATHTPATGTSEHEADCSKRRLSAESDNILCQEYRVGSMDMIGRLCKVACHYPALWKKAMKGYLGRFVSSFYKENKSAHAEADLNAIPAIDHPLKTLAPKLPTERGNNALDTNTAIILRDCIICVLYTRYLPLLSEEEQGTAITAINKTWQSIGMEPIPTSKQFLENFCLAAGLTLRLFQNHSGQHINRHRHSSVHNTKPLLERAKSIVGATAHFQGGSDLATSGSMQKFPQELISRFLSLAIQMPEGRPLRALLGSLSLWLISFSVGVDSGCSRQENICLIDRTNMSTLLLEEIFGISFKSLAKTDPSAAFGSCSSIFAKISTAASLLKPFAAAERKGDNEPDDEEEDIEFEQFSEEYSSALPTIKLKSSSEILLDLFILLILLKEYPISSVFSGLWEERVRILHQRTSINLFGGIGKIRFASEEEHLDHIIQYQFSFEENNRFVTQCSNMDEGWHLLVREIEKPLRVLRSCFQSLDVSLGTSCAARPIWREFQWLLEMAISSGEYDSGKALAAESVYALIQRIKSRLTPKNGFVLYTAIAFQLSFDSYSGMRRVLHLLMDAGCPSNAPLKGIVSVRMAPKKDDESNNAEDDEFDDDENNKDKQGEDAEEEDVEILSDRSKNVLKKILTLLSVHSHGMRRDHFRSNINSIALITINLPQWTAWIADSPVEADMPLSGYHHFSWIEKFFIASEIKPVALASMLRKEIVEVGLSLTAISLFAETLIIADVDTPFASRNAAEEGDADEEGEGFKADDFAVGGNITAPMKGFVQIIHNSDGTFNTSFPYDVRSPIGEDVSLMKYFWAEADFKFDLLAGLVKSKRNAEEQVAVGASATAATNVSTALSTPAADVLGGQRHSKLQEHRRTDVSTLSSTSENAYSGASAAVVAEHATGSTPSTAAGDRNGTRSSRMESDVNMLDQISHRKREQKPILIHVICAASSMNEHVLHRLRRFAVDHFCIIYLETSFFIAVPKRLNALTSSILAGSDGVLEENRFEVDKWKGFHKQMEIEYIDDVDLLPSTGMFCKASVKSTAFGAQIEDEDNDMLRVQSIQSLDFVMLVKRSLRIVRSVLQKFQYEPEFSNTLWLLCLSHSAIIYKLGGKGPMITDDMLRAATSVFLMLCSTPSKSKLLDATDLDSLDPANFLHYLVNCVYCRACDSELKHGYIQSIISSFFTSGSTNVKLSYYIRGLLELPSGFSVSHQDDFLIDLASSLSSEIRISELVASAGSELNNTAYHTIAAVLTDLKYYCASTSTKATSFSSPMGCHKYLCIGAKPQIQWLQPYLDERSIRCLHVNLVALRALLPDCLQLDTPRIVDKMTQKNLIYQEQQKTKGKKKVVHQHTHKRAHKSHTNREFDPLWAFVMTEAHKFNSDLSRLHQLLGTWITMTSTVRQYLASMGTYINESASDSNIDSLASIADVFDAILNMKIPYCWLSFVASTSLGQPITSTVSFDSWTSHQIERREMLSHWLTAGFPTTVQLHLLSDPHSLLHCMKEYFAMKNGLTLDKVYIDANVLELKEIEAIDVNTVYLEKQGCAVIARNVQLFNAKYSSGSLAFSPPFSANSYGQELGILISAVNDISIHEEEYECPLFISSVSAWSGSITFEHAVPVCAMKPMNRQKLHSTQFSPWSSVNTIPAFMKVPITTIEDIDDCKSFGVVLHSCPPWHSPVN